MSTVGRTADELVDRFVNYLNAAGFEPKLREEISEELRTSDADSEMFHWQIRPASSNPWVKEFEERLPLQWPTPFRSLIDRYRFSNIEVGPLMLFANSGHNLFYELSKRVFADEAIFPLLHKHGLLQFGLPQETNYDPVCFDMQHRNRDDAPIVQLDHEDVLLRNRIRKVKEIAPSFSQFMQRAITERFPVS